MSARNDAGWPGRTGFLLIWYVLGCVLLSILPALKSHVPFWADDYPETGAVWLSGAFLLGGLVITLASLAGRRAPALSISLPLAFFCATFLFFLIERPAPVVSRSVVVGVFAAALLLSIAAEAPRSARARRGALGALLLVTLAAGGLEAHRLRAERGVHLEVIGSDIPTAFYTLHTVAYRNALPGTDVRGGGISLLGDDYLLATGDGRLYVFGWSGPGGVFAIRSLPYHVPANREAFAADANPQGYAGKPNGGDLADRLQGVQTWQFRVADVRVQEQGERVRIFASHHYWYHDRQCFVVRLSSLEGARSAVLAGDPALTWRTVYETTPCVPLHGEMAVHENNPFAGMEIGGRIGFLSEQRLLLTLGDHDFTGVESKQMFAQDPSVSYGKTILVHLEDGSSEQFTLGHRNPQGLYITPEGEIWSTEHGPQGGDELNRLVKGANYGWPLVTYGTDYGSAAWPLSHDQGRHEGYQQPTFVWIPSIGVSNLVRIERDSPFPVWKGDFLIGSLHGHALFRVRLLEGHVIFSEPIEMGERIRDLVEGHDGRLVLWTDTSTIISLAPASGTGGAVLFATTCGGCHKAIDGATHSYGPDLAGIVGSRVASAPGFSYSAAFKAQQGRWTRERLDAFLAAPQSTVPGTAMTFRGLPDAAQREAIIDYLAGTRRQ
ncbi:MAG TPA: PQQ-dependent sugar dehydrogenase [Steroidobacteraceae bacterium]|nr:PQQ-dependent sugar dehydrogenase [Steroidobacteraceae bacterium]